MKITNISIEKFRSIQSLTFDTLALTAICGPNSCGKSNILRAIKFAFLPSYSAERMPDNLCHKFSSPNAACRIKLTFDVPTSKLANLLGISADQPFTYSVSVKRKGTKRVHLNGMQLSEEQRKKIIDEVLIVHVPPIRDIATEGLNPFKDALADALRKTRGATGFAKLNDRVRNIVKARGQKLLDTTKLVARQLLNVNELLVDTDRIDLEQLLPVAGLKVRIGKKELCLDKLGTGHQSSVILKLYRQIGEKSERFVLYLFEEPDNHLHPTALRTIGEDLHKCAAEHDAQVLLTTHSPYLLNQFDHRNILALASDSDYMTLKRPKKVNRTDHEVRVALGKYGLKPAEALLAAKVIVVEGLNDVTFLSTLVELETKITPDRQDILIVPAGGKQSAADLATFLEELGVNWRAFFDWDVTENTSAPLFQAGLNTADKIALTAAAKAIKEKLHILPAKGTRAKKIVDAMLKELAAPATSRAVFTGSTLDTFVRKLKLFDTAQLSSLANAIASHQIVKIRQTLSKKHIWLWSSTIEEIIIRNTNTENETDAILRRRGVLTQTFANPNDRRSSLLNIIHDSANEPALIREIVETLWNAKQFDRSEVKSATKFILK